MNNVYLGIITDKGQFKNLEELTSIYNYFDGLAVTYHGSPNDEEFKLLNERKGCGFIECIKYFGHHSHSMNHFLFNPIVRVNDTIILRDSSERINIEFASNIKPFVKMLENNNINTVYQHSKLLLFRRFPFQSFNSTPHWGFSGARDNKIQIEKMGWFKEDKEYCYSVRNDTRDKYHFVDAFMRYYLILDSNHNLLGLENFGNPSQLFPILEQQRMSFLLYLQELGINNDVDTIKNWLLSKEDDWKLPDKMKEYINSILILNQFYRYHVLNDLTVSPDIAAPIVKIS